MTIENNWSDRYENELIDEDNRRYSELATLLRARFLVDVDCWTEVLGQPLKPGTVEKAILGKYFGIVRAQIAVKHRGTVKQ